MQNCADIYIEINEFAQQWMQPANVCVSITKESEVSAFC